jgi:hypothetical protein
VHVVVSSGVPNDCRQAYSPKCAEEEFSEVRGSKHPHPGVALGHRGGAMRGGVANWQHFSYSRGVDLLRAVATCNVWTS